MHTVGSASRPGGGMGPSLYGPGPPSCQHGWIRSALLVRTRPWMTDVGPIICLCVLVFLCNPFLFAEVCYRRKRFEEAAHRGSGALRSAGQLPAQTASRASNIRSRHGWLPGAAQGAPVVAHVGEERQAAPRAQTAQVGGVRPEPRVGHLPVGGAEAGGGQGGGSGRAKQLLQVPQPRPLPPFSF